MDIVPSRHLLSTASRFSKISLSFAGPLGLLASLVPRYIISRPVLTELLALPFSSSRLLLSAKFYPRDSQNSIPKYTDYVKRNKIVAVLRCFTSAQKNYVIRSRNDDDLIILRLTIENHFVFANTEKTHFVCEICEKLCFRTLVAYENKYFNNKIFSYAQNEFLNFFHSIL